MSDSRHDTLETAQTMVSGGPLAGDLATIDTSSPRYERTGTLGEGGMGEVVLCNDRRIGREVAKKIMRVGAHTDAKLRARFLREALVQGKLEHPSIVPVYDVALDDAGVPYFTMKRVRGTTLADILERLRAGDVETSRTYSRHKLLAAFANACLAVDFAHKHGVVHRDLKPDNVMLGDFGEVYVLDWGIAKIDRSPESSPTAGVTPLPGSGNVMTEHGAVLGTPGYLAPEQIEGVAVDGRADVYALGVTLFELLTLKPLHEGPSGHALCMSALKGADARPSVRAPSRDVPPELEAICVQATARSPVDRFASARELENALTRFLEGDRDLERRRELSREHARRAAALGEGAEASASAASRADALRELGRALVLDPENRTAADQLVELLTKAPAEVPPEVDAAIASENLRLVSVKARWGAIGFALWFVSVPIFAWMGIRHPLALVLTLFPFAGAMATQAALARKPTTGGPMAIASQAFMGLSALAGCAVLGPLIVVPQIVVLFVLAITLGATSSPSQRWAPLLIGCLAIALPVAAEGLGILPPSYAFEGSNMLVLPRMVELPRQTFWLVTGVSITLVAMAARMGTDFQVELSRAQRRLHLYAWQLRQLVPHRGA